MPDPSLPKALMAWQAMTAEERNQHLAALATAANQNDAAAKTLHAFCKAHPEVWQQFGRLEQEAIDS